MAGFEFLLAGRTLADRYRLEAVIGRGGMGAVFRAADLRLDRPVAVKVVAAHEEDDGRVRARFRREAQSAARIRHPHVVTVFDYGTDPELNLDFLVMELLEGEDLARRVARHGALSPALGIRVLRDTAEGLAAGHRLGLVHRDVKPGNVFLAEPGDPPRTVLLDFGIAKAHAEEEDTQTALTRVGGSAPHSPGFAAPEQLRGDAPLTPACDIFSLAATAYYALSGERAFTAQQLQALAAGEPVALVPLTGRVAAIPPEVDRALAAGLNPDPARRPADADAFLALLAGAEVPAVALPPVPAPAPLPRRARAAQPPARRSLVVPLLGLAGATALAAAAMTVWPLTPSAPAAPPLAVDSTAIRDSLALDSARADSTRRAAARRDSLRLARVDTAEAAPALPPVDSVVLDTPAVIQPVDEIYEVGALTRRPTVANRGQMRRVAERFYPPMLRDAGIEGRVLVGLVIGTDGRPVPGSIRALDTDHPLFAEAAVRIAEELRFRPGEIDGRRVRVATSLPIDFQVRQ